ncbi:heavy metal-associated domain-containing protein [Kribbella sp. NPDC023855]|uniref:heavy-metal-associated domain-containing protein n=1 Tax=Kribbella sp. NPDC023855 TaxID=3154698 RepID=UPI0033CAAEB0
MTSQEFQVLGMTCGHCVTFVTEGLERLPGVTAVAVDLSAGTVTLTSEKELGLPQIQTALEEAGYELADHPEGKTRASSGPAKPTNGSGRQP